MLMALSCVRDTVAGGLVLCALAGAALPAAAMGQVRIEMGAAAPTGSPGSFNSTGPTVAVSYLTGSELELGVSAEAFYSPGRYSGICDCAGRALRLVGVGVIAAREWGERWRPRLEVGVSAFRVATESAVQTTGATIGVGLGRTLPRFSLFLSLHATRLELEKLPQHLGLVEPGPVPARPLGYRSLRAGVEWTP